MTRAILQHAALTFVLVILGLTAAACSGSSLVTSEGRDGELSYAMLNEQLLGNEVVLSFQSGLHMTGTGFHIDQDTASWIEVDTGHRLSVPVSTIDEVSVSPNALLGGVIGFGSGVVAGGLIGAGAANLAVGSEEDRNLITEIGMLAGAGAGAIIGTVIGIHRGPSRTYQFKSATPAK